MCLGLHSVNSLLLFHQKKIASYFIHLSNANRVKSLSKTIHFSIIFIKKPVCLRPHPKSMSILTNLLQWFLSINHSHGTQFKDDDTVFLHWKHLIDVNRITTLLPSSLKRENVFFYPITSPYFTAFSWLSRQASTVISPQCIQKTNKHLSSNCWG